VRLSKSIPTTFPKLSLTCGSGLYLTIRVLGGVRIGSYTLGPMPLGLFSRLNQTPKDSYSQVKKILKDF
jgi:hypothetical protein